MKYIMSDFFHKPCCECNLDYIMAWIFFVLSNAFLGYIVWVNPIGIDYTPNVKSIKFILSCAYFFLVSLITRCFCKSNKKYFDLENTPQYVAI
jgi:hypothetical protein